jgi:hypothetical protein
MLHFGDSLAPSTTDFGARAARPENAELLDWLAADFIRSGWSVKHLHRVMMLSSAYQQSSEPALVSKSKQHGKSTVATSNPDPDPENKLLSHFPRRRMDYEAMRDSMLFISGRLDSTMGGRPVDQSADPMNIRRSVYGLVDRQDLPAVQRAFDFPAPDQCLERRPQTTVPQQALFAMNSPFVLEQARALAARSEISGSIRPAARIEALFQRVYGRRPTTIESARAQTFLDSAATDKAAGTSISPWEQLAQVLLISNESIFVD